MRPANLFTILAISLTLMLGSYLRVVSSVETVVVKPVRADALDYFMYAYNMKFKHTYSKELGHLKDPTSSVTPDALRTPGYPLFLLAFVNGLPNSVMIKRISIVQALLSILTIVITFILLRRILRPLWACAALLLVAFSPHLIVASSYILTETLFCFLIVFLGWFFASFVTQPSSWKAVVLGSVIALSALVRPGIQYFVVVTAVFIVLCKRQKRSTGYAILILCAFLLTFGP